MKKEEVLSGALALNGQDKDYLVTVEKDKIITTVKWMDATFFAPGQVTKEMQEFKFIAKVKNNNKYEELDKNKGGSFAVTGKGLNKKITYFAGQSITYDKTIGVGKNNIDGSSGIIESTFYSENYKNPVRSYLASCGYRKAMSSFTKKIIIFSAVVVALAVALVIAAFANTDSSKERKSLDDFCSYAESLNLEIVDSKKANGVTEDYVEHLYVAADEEIHIEYWDLSDEKTAKSLYEFNKESFVDEYGGSSSYVSRGNYSKVIITGNNDKYMIITRIEDTLVIAATSKDNKDNLDKTVEDFGY